MSPREGDELGPFSDAQALVLRGLFQEAIDCYQGCAAEYPEDPEPCIRIARIYRDHLGSYEEAVTWVRRARNVIRNYARPGDLGHPGDHRGCLVEAGPAAAGDP